MKKDKIWTNTTREFLYTKLIGKFGPYKEWELKKVPNKNNNDDYEKFCKEIAKSIGAKSGGAVSNQIDWALSTSIFIKPSHITTWLENKYIARKIGFIDNSSIPKTIECKY